MQMSERMRRFKFHSSVADKIYILDADQLQNILRIPRFFHHKIAVHSALKSLHKSSTATSKMLIAFADDENLSSHSISILRLGLRRYCHKTKQYGIYSTIYKHIENDIAYPNILDSIRNENNNEKNDISQNPVGNSLDIDNIIHKVFVYGQGDLLTVIAAFLSPLYVLTELSLVNKHFFRVVLQKPTCYSSLSMSDLFEVRQSKQGKLCVHFVAADYPQITQLNSLELGEELQWPPISFIKTFLQSKNIKLIDKVILNSTNSFMLRRFKSICGRYSSTVKHLEIRNQMPFPLFFDKEDICFEKLQKLSLHSSLVLQHVHVSIWCNIEELALYRNSPEILVSLIKTGPCMNHLRHNLRRLSINGYVWPAAKPIYTFISALKNLKYLSLSGYILMNARHVLDELSCNSLNHLELSFRYGYEIPFSTDTIDLTDDTNEAHESNSNDGLDDSIEVTDASSDKFSQLVSLDLHLQFKTYQTWNARIDDLFQNILNSICCFDDTGKKTLNLKSLTINRHVNIVNLLKKYRINNLKYITFYTCGLENRLFWSEYWRYYMKRLSTIREQNSDVYIDFGSFVARFSSTVLQNIFEEDIRSIGNGRFSVKLFGSRKMIAIEMH